ncbi:hypothetical protein KM043_006423 [Ampulex compressa]|nr:hypothetical protein KM043_006423 [Ampulex compressa]
MDRAGDAYQAAFLPDGKFVNGPWGASESTLPSYARIVLPYLLCLLSIILLYPAGTLDWTRTIRGGTSSLPYYLFVDAPSSLGAIHEYSLTRLIVQFCGYPRHRGVQK